MRKKLVRVAIIFATLFFTLFALVGYEGTPSVAEHRNGPDIIGIISANAIEGGADSSYPGNIYDGDLNTFWQLANGVNSGKIELAFAEPELLYGINLTYQCEPNARISFEFNDSGLWIQFPIAPVKANGSSEDSIIDLSSLRVVTDKIRLSITGTGSGNSVNKIFEVMINGIKASEVFRKLVPENVTVNGGKKSWYPISNLFDNNTYTAWYSGKSDHDDRFDGFCKPPSRWRDKITDGDQDQDSFHLTFSSGTILKEVRFHPVMNKNTGIKITAQTGSNTIKLYDYYGALKDDWYIVSAENVGLIDRIGVSVDGDNHNPAGLAELECWGYGTYTGKKYIPVGFSSQILNKEITGIFNNEFGGNGSLMFLVEGNHTEPLVVYINSTQYSILPINNGNGTTFYSIKLRPFINDENPDQSVTVLPFTDQSPQLYGIWLTGSVLFDEQETDIYHAYKSSQVSGNWDHQFSEKVLAQDFEIYKTEGSSPSLKGNTNGVWTPLQMFDSGDLWSRWRLPDSTNQTLDGIRFEGIVPETLYGIRLLGSIYSNHAPRVRIIKPNANAELDLEGNDQDNGILEGFVDNEKAIVTINGKKSEQKGNFFRYDIDRHDLEQEGSITLQASAKDDQGRVGQDSLTVSLIDYLFTVNLTQDITYVSIPSVVVSGSCKSSNIQVSVNGVKATQNNRSYSATVVLTEGINYITIYGKNIKTGKSRTALRRVYYNKNGLTITIDSPLNGEYIGTATCVITGRVQGGGSCRVTVNGANALITGTIFRSLPVTLIEGANSINVIASDNQGHSAQQSITVYRDTTKPVISVTTPFANAIINHSDVSVTIDVTDASRVWVLVNGQPATLNGNIFTTVLSLSDGAQNINVTAIDRTGNQSSSILPIIVDTTPPLPFSITITPSGWTNCIQPVVSFATIDATSGLDYFELSVDDQIITNVTSPYTLPVLPNGAHTITVTAFDKAGWQQVASAQALIDKTPPEAPSSFNIIPGDSKVIISYALSSDDTVRYVIERAPEWLNGPISTNEPSITDTGLTNGSQYEYRVQAIDRAGNAGMFTEWKTIMCARELEPCIASQITVVEYDGATLYIPAGGLYPETKNVMITQVSSTELDQVASFSRVSPIFTFEPWDESNTAVKPGEFLPASYIGSIRYDKAMIPAGLSEDDLDVYYFNTHWDRWFKCDSVVDKDHSLIFFTSNHFSMYDVQATAAKNVSADELRKTGYSPFRTYMVHGSFDVAPDTGSLSNTVKELVLPGPAGFDLTISRLYTTSTAKADALVVVEKELLPFLNQKADLAFKVGKGIRLDFPYIKQSSMDENLVLPGGATYSLWSLRAAAFKTLPHEWRAQNNTNVLWLTPVDNEDFHLYINTTTRQMINIHWYSNYGTVPIPVERINYYKLIMHDGTVYDIDNKGRPVKMTDPTGQNTISFVYTPDGNQINYIQDAIGRKVFFTYATINDLPYIKTISIKTINSDDDPYNRVITYTHDDNGYLIGEKDAGGREWSYKYDPTIQVTGVKNIISYDFLAAVEGIKEVNANGVITGGHYYWIQNNIISKYWDTTPKYYPCPLLSELRGPGKGILKASYDQFSESSTGLTVVSGVEEYTNETNYLNNTPQRRTKYHYDPQTYVITPGSQQDKDIPTDKRSYISSMISNDGDRETIVSAKSIHP